MSHGAAGAERLGAERTARRVLDGVHTVHGPLLTAGRRKPSLPIALEGYAGFTLIVVAHAVEGRYAAAARQIGISLRDFVVLAEAAHVPGVHQGALAERVGLRPSRLSEQLRVLATAGYVERPIYQGDLRVRRIFPTFAGQELVEAAKVKMDEIERGWLSAIDARERPAFVAAVRRLSPALTNRFGGA
jgi:DNA-binding MarR family transcriptional regulator